MLGQSSSRKKILITIGLIFLVIIILNIFQKNLRNFSYKIFSPFQQITFNFGNKVSTFLNGLGQPEKIGKKIKQLQLKNEKLTAEISSLKEIKTENKKLREALNVGLEKKFNLSSVEIIGKEISGDSLIINKGENEKIKKDMPLITPEGVIVGKISKVYKNFSEVDLLSNKKMSFDVKIQTKKGNINGLAQGKGNSKILINFIPKEENISKGNVVVSSSLGGIFPKNFLIGKVEEIKKKDTQPFQEVEIKPAFSIEKAEILFVITDQKK